VWWQLVLLCGVAHGPQVGVACLPRAGFVRLLGYMVELPPRFVFRVFVLLFQRVVVVFSGSGIPAAQGRGAKRTHLF
jgi:hypothetical protein